MNKKVVFWVRVAIFVAIFSLLSSMGYDFRTWQYWAIAVLIFLQGATFILQED